MKARFLFFSCFALLAGSSSAQTSQALDSAIREIARVESPDSARHLAGEAISKFNLARATDAETLDMLYGAVAVSYASKADSVQAAAYFDSVANPFNRTSYMNMAASRLLDEKNHVLYANSLAVQTLHLYQQIREDPAARPADFPVNDWTRFMNFAQYPYYDTYARALFESKQYKEALIYQQKAFDTSPVEGMPGSVARYARLLAENDRTAEAKDLLLQRAAVGTLNDDMLTQLQSIYIDEKGSDQELGVLLDSLSRNLQKNLAAKLRPKMIGRKAPGFTLHDLNGKKVSLSDFAGRIVVLDLWATWCKPCIASFPAMQLMVNKHPEVSFLFIAVQELEENPLPHVKAFVEKRNYPFTVLLDEPVSKGSEQFRILSAYRPDGIPAKYIIDKKGMLQFQTSGFNTDAELTNELEAMFSILNEPGS